MLRYFAAGEEALKNAFPPELAEEMARLLPRYQLLARQELDALCKDCVRRGFAGYCALAEAPLNAAP
jgi:hypothetical protein